MNQQRAATILTAAVFVLTACGAPPTGNDGGGGGFGGGFGGGSAGGAAGGSAGGAAGGSGGGTAGGSAGGTAGGSAGGAGGGSGGGSAGGPVTITFSTSCPALNPCPSSPLGTWHYTAACVDSNNPYPAIKRACAGISFTNLAGTTTGSVVVTASTTSRVGTANITGDIAVPSACVATWGGCAGVQAALNTMLTTVSCSGTTTCACTFADVSSRNQTDPSSYSGSTLTVNPGTSSARTYGYCLSLGSLTYQETTAAVSDTGIYTMQQ